MQGQSEFISSHVFTICLPLAGVVTAIKFVFASGRCCQGDRELLKFRELKKVKVDKDLLSDLQF